MPRIKTLYLKSYQHIWDAARHVGALAPFPRRLQGSELPDPSALIFSEAPTSLKRTRPPSVNRKKPWLVTPAELCCHFEGAASSLVRSRSGDRFAPPRPPTPPFCCRRHPPLEKSAAGSGPCNYPPLCRELIDAS